MQKKKGSNLCPKSRKIQTELYITVHNLYKKNATFWELISRSQTDGLRKCLYARPLNNVVTASPNSKDIAITT